MSEENLEAFKRGIEVYNRGDVEALLALLDPAIEWHMALQAALGGGAAIYHGHEGVREYLRDMDEAFAEVHLDFSDIRDLDDRILAVGSFHTVGRGSGAEIESPLGVVVDVRDEKLTRVLTYLDRNEALEAAGLPE